MTKNQNQEPENDLPAKLAQPAKRALFGAGYFKLEQLSHVRESDIRKLHGIGKNALKQLKEAMEEKGLSFAGEE